VIAPVPLHRSRLWWRRFNQAMALSAGRCRAPAACPADPFLLVRVKRTRPQVGLTKNQPARTCRAPSGCLPRQSRACDGKRVLLIDDVVTTGATANACSRALLRGGASAVDVLTFAESWPMAEPPPAREPFRPWGVVRTSPHNAVATLRPSF
jgi:predicted amidophosphoribosyltransferase